MATTKSFLCSSCCDTQSPDTELSNQAPNPKYKQLLNITEYKQLLNKTAIFQSCLLHCLYTPGEIGQNPKRCTLPGEVGCRPGCAACAQQPAPPSRYLFLPPSLRPVLDHPEPSRRWWVPGKGLWGARSRAEAGGQPGRWSALGSARCWIALGDEGCSPFAA